MRIKDRIIMIGPDPLGFGGISRVVTIWQKNDFFSHDKIDYVSTVSEDRNRWISLLIAVIRFLLFSQRGCRCVYIHTASFNSFYRKSLFIVLSIFIGNKIILHIHPSYFPEFLSKAGSIKKRYSYWLLRRIDCFVVLTKEMKKEIQGIFPCKSIFVLRNPVDMAGLSPIGGTKRIKNQVLFLGWYVKEKGIFDLVDACRLLVNKGIDIKIVFYGTKDHLKLREYVERQGLGRVISVNGWADNSTKNRALYSSAMLVLPSYTEGIPNVVLEAMATKTPIVATAVGGLKEILIDGENAFIAKVGDAKDLSEKILQCLENKKLRESFANRAYENCYKLYDVGVIKKELRYIFNKICSD